MPLLNYNYYYYHQIAHKMHKLSTFQNYIYSSVLGKRVAATKSLKTRQEKRGQI